MLLPSLRSLLVNKLILINIERPRVTMKEMERSTAQIRKDVYRTTIALTHLKAVLY